MCAITSIFSVFRQHSEKINSNNALKWFYRLHNHLKKISETNNSWSLMVKQVIYMVWFTQDISHLLLVWPKFIISSNQASMDIAQELYAIDKRWSQLVWVITWKYPDLRFIAQDAKKFTFLNSNMLTSMEHSSELLSHISS